ncbi:MAG: sigma-54-dependent transcriptional regulator [Bacteroidota bacterium]
MAKHNSKVLIADDDEFVCLSLKLLLEQHEIETVAINSPERIPAILEKNSVHAILLDMNFRQGDTSSTQGLFWLRKIMEVAPEIPVVLITAFGEISLAVEAMKQGAHDFITKPWQNEKLLATIKNSLALYQEKRKVKQLTSQQKIINSMIDRQYEGLVGEAASIHLIRKTIEKIATTDATVLILGGNGTGKEVIAREIHRKSLRSDQIFVNVDAGSLSETLFESELFGHKKGAFTDAKEDRVGRIEASSGGTLFLDEIGNLPLALQAKLLTVMQHKTITRLGTNHPIPVDMRIICATNANLKKLVLEGQFREDLYYRINTVEITMPPLCDRLEDIPVLANYFLQKFAAKYLKEKRAIPDEVMQALQRYRWPGNIRELQHAVERAVILSEGTVLKLEDFGIIRNEHSGDLIFDHLNLEKLECWAIRKAIDKHHGNVSHAAHELGLSRGAMYRRMEKYGL